MEQTMASKVFDFFLKCFVIISTCFWIPVPSNMKDMVEWGYQSQELFFRYGVVLLFGLSLFVKQKRTCNLTVIGVLIAYLIVNSIIGYSFDVQIRRTLLNIFIGAVFYKLVADYADINLKSIGTWFFWLIAFNGVMMTLQYFYLDPLFAPAIPGQKLHEMSGMMGIEPHMGSLVAILSPLLCFINPLLLLICLPILFATKNSTAVLAFAIT